MDQVIIGVGSSVALNVVGNIATAILGHSRILERTQVGRILKHYNIMPKRAADHLREVLESALKDYFVQHTDYLEYSGIKQFFLDPIVGQQLAQFVLDGKPIDEHQIRQSFEKYTDEDRLTRALVNEHGLKAENIISDFVVCYQNALLEKRDEPLMAMQITLIQQAVEDRQDSKEQTGSLLPSETQNTLDTEARLQRLLEEGQFDSTFDDIVAERTQHFIGRKRVFDKIAQWSAGQGSHLFLLKGPPGSGKTAILAKLSQTWASADQGQPGDGSFSITGSWIAAVHFCTVSRPETGNPAAVAKSLARQLEWTDRSFRAALLMEAATENINWQDGEKAWERLVRKPLERLAGRRCLIMIDGLDEAHAAKLVRFLGESAKNKALSHVYWLVAGRPQATVADWLKDADQLDLEEVTSADTEDILHYTKARLEELMATDMTASQRADLAQQIAEKARGNFLYAHYVLESAYLHEYLLPAIQQGQSLDVEFLPDGLESIYGQFLDRIVDDEEEQQWFQKYYHLVETLAVVLGEGPDKETLQVIDDWDRDLVSQGLRDLEMYLTSAKRGVRFYHPSFSQYLKEYRGIREGTAHRYVAGRLVRAWGDKRWTRARPYALRYTPAHWIAGIKADDSEAGTEEAINGLVGVLTDLNYLAARLEMLEEGRTAALERDYTDAIAAVAAEPEKQAILKTFAAALERESGALQAHPQEAFGQLYNRLYQSRNTAVRERLAGQAAERGWFQAYVPLPEQAALQRKMASPKESLLAIAVPKKGMRAFCGGQNGQLSLWDCAPGGGLLTSWDGHAMTVRTVALTPDGRRAISGAVDGTVHIWDLEAGGPVALGVGTRHAAAVRAVAISADGGRATSVDANLMLFSWEPAGGGESQRDLAAEARPRMLPTEGGIFTVEAVTLAAGGSWLAAVVAWSPPDEAPPGPRDPERGLLCWNLARPQAPQVLIGPSARQRVLALTPDGCWLAAGGDDGEVYLWDLAHPEQEPHKSPRLHPNLVRALAIRSEERLVVLSGDQAHQLQYWDAVGGWVLPLPGHGAPVSAVAAEKDWAVSGDTDGGLCRWDLAAAAASQEAASLTGAVWAVDLPADQSTAVGGGEAPPLRLWNLEDGTAGPTLPVPDQRIHTAAVTPDGKRILSGGDAGRVCLWDLEQQILLHELAAGSGRVRAVALTPTGDALLSGGDDGVLRLWTGPSWTELRQWPYGAAIRAVALDPAANLAVFAGERGAPWVWDLTADSVNQFGEGAAQQFGLVLAVALGGGRHLALAGGADGMLQLWEPRQRTLLRAWPSHDGHGISTLAVDRAGRWAVSGGVDQTLCLWDLKALLDSPENTPPEPRACYTWEVGFGCCALNVPAGSPATGGARRPLTVVAGDEEGRLLFFRLAGLPGY